MQPACASKQMTREPFRSVKGLWADLGISISAEELEDNQREMWKSSIQTTEQYLGCKQKLRYAVNDKMGINT